MKVSHCFKHNHSWISEATDDDIVLLDKMVAEFFTLLPLGYIVDTKVESVCSKCLKGERAWKIPEWALFKNDKGIMCHETVITDVLAE